MTSEVAVRDLRNHGGEILNRVAGGETLTVTRDGAPVAELRPLPRRPLQAGLLLRRWRAQRPASSQGGRRLPLDSRTSPPLAPPNL